MPKRILIAPNAFKHSLSAIEIANVIKSSIDSLNIDVKCELAPIADGGDGTIDVIKFYFKNSRFVECTVSDPLMRKIRAKWLLLDKETAVIELAKASGLSLLKENELNPMWANTYGTGEMILSALDKGIKKIILTLGGSATVDGGVGILQRLGVRILDKKKNIVKPGGGFLSTVETIDLSLLDRRVKNCSMHLLCDVKIPLIGEKGTVKRFATQKGAKEGEKIILENAMRHYAEIVKNFVGVDYQFDPMVGAAGGVAFSLRAILNAELHLGFPYLSRLVGLDEKVKSTDLIITGEGNLDSQTILGKGVYELAKIANSYKKKMIALCGDYDKQIDWPNYHISKVLSIKPENLPLSESIKNAKDLIKKAIISEYKQFINC